MGRTQGFDTDAAVRCAREVFWESGYEDAAIPALESATGLNRSSIYNAFGSKRGLFDAAVDSYLDEVVRPLLRPLTATPVAPDAIVEYLARLRHAFLDESSPASANGCLLINSANAPIARDSAVREVVAAYRQELRFGHRARRRRPPPHARAGGQRPARRRLHRHDRRGLRAHPRRQRGRTAVHRHRRTPPRQPRLTRRRHRLRSTDSARRTPGRRTRGRRTPGCRLIDNDCQ